MCDWSQLSDSYKAWLLGSGSSPSPNTGPDWDHTTNTPGGHYLYLASSATDPPSQVARIASPLIPAGDGRYFGSVCFSRLNMLGLIYKGWCVGDHAIVQSAPGCLGCVLQVRGSVCSCGSTCLAEAREP